MINACESLNARAVALMKIGDNEGARSMLLSALHLLKGVVGHEKGATLAPDHKIPFQSADNCCDSESKSGPLSRMLDSDEKFHVFPSELPPTTCVYQHGFQHSMMMMYRSAFVHLSPIFSPSFDLLREQTRISAVILYNLALTHHLRWMDCGCSMELYQASRLYRIALASTELSCSGLTDDMAMVALAILNNMGVLSTEIFDYTESTYFGGQALAFLSCIDSMSLLSHEDYIFFQTNALILKKLSEASAAAA